MIDFLFLYINDGEENQRKMQVKGPCDRLGNFRVEKLDGPPNKPILKIGALKPVDL